MSTPISDKLTDLERALLADLCSECGQLVLFGSRAVGTYDEESDFDLLCVGTGITRRQGRLHIVFKTQSELKEGAKAGEDWALHIERYGVWLEGQKPVLEIARQPEPAVLRRKMGFVLGRTDS